MLIRLASDAFGYWHRLGTWFKPSRELSVLEEYAVKHHPAAQILAELGRLYIRMNCPKSAERCLRRYVAVHPESAQAHAVIAELCLTQNKYRQALKDSARALKHDRNCRLGHTTMGVAHFQLGQWAETVRALRQALWLSDESGEKADFHSILAKAHDGLGEAEQADEHRRKARELGADSRPGGSAAPAKGS
jgi:tetratricopeptide (TPR) repeat protein